MTVKQLHFLEQAEAELYSMLSDLMTTWKSTEHSDHAILVMTAKFTKEFTQLTLVDLLKRKPFELSNAFMKQLGKGSADVALQCLREANLKTVKVKGNKPYEI
jgi:hypothetical protein